MTSVIIDFERKVLKNQDVGHVEIKCAVMTFVLMVIYISLSSTVQVVWEDWAFTDAFYAWFITFTTVGFGDYIPFESVVPRDDRINTAFFHIIGTFPALCGLCLVASVINVLFRVFDRQGMKTDSIPCCEHSKDCRIGNVKGNGELQFAKTDPGIKPSQVSKRPHSI